MARSATIPAPVGGWNTRDPLDGMDPRYALRLVNWIPEQASLTLRRGYAVHATAVGTGAVQSLFEHVAADGTASLIAASGGKLFNATAADDATELKSGLNSDKWQGFSFSNKLLLFNGADQPQQWDGTTLSDATYTGISDDAVFIQGTAYRSRVYLVEKDSTKVWFGGVRSITGALTDFDIGSLLTKGGYLQFVATWTRESGQALSENFVFCSSQGEVLVYSGASPDLDSWALVAHVYLPKPLGRRAFMQRGSDLEIITKGGVFSLSLVLSQGSASASVSAYTDAIQDTFTGAARLYSANHGWEAVGYDKRNLILYNVPVTESAKSEQYVRNSLSGAWCRFTGWNACSWATLGDNLYFGGTDGKVYKADTANSDNGAAIATEIKLAYNYLGQREHEKHFKMARPLVKANNALSFYFDIDTDFFDRELTNTVSVSGIEGAAWDEEDWDAADWGEDSRYSADWRSIAGTGRAGALKLKGDFLNVEASISAFHIQYDVGGIL